MEYNVDYEDKGLSDRVLVLEVIDGEKPKSSTGLTDSRLFTGANKLHAIMDIQSTLWSLKYEMGGVPEEFKQRFTSFSKLKSFVDDYYATRNVRIKEVIW